MVRFRKTSKSKLLKRGGKSVKKRGKTLKKKGKSVKRMGKYNKNKRGKRRNTLKRGGFLGLFGGPPPASREAGNFDKFHMDMKYNGDGTYTYNHNGTNYKYSRTSTDNGGGPESTTYNYTLIGPVQ